VGGNKAYVVHGAYSALKTGTFTFCIQAAAFSSRSLHYNDHVTVLLFLHGFLTLL